MAKMSVNFSLRNFHLTDKFDVKRRAQTVSSKGRVTTTDVLTKNIIGVVTAGSPNDLQRNDSNQVMPRVINVVTDFRLRSETANQQPDIVIWHGSNYVVVAIDNYPQFGDGFVQAECHSMDLVDPAIDPVPAQMAFNDKANAIYTIFR